MVRETQSRERTLATKTNWSSSLEDACNRLREISRDLKPLPNLQTGDALWEEHKTVNAKLFEQLNARISDEKKLDQRHQEAKKEWEGHGIFKRLFNKLLGFAPDLVAMEKDVKRAMENVSRLEDAEQQAREKIQNDPQAYMRVTCPH